MVDIWNEKYYILIYECLCSMVKTWMIYELSMYFDGDMLCAIHYSGGPYPLACRANVADPYIAISGGA